MQCLPPTARPSPRLCRFQCKKTCGWCNQPRGRLESILWAQLRSLECRPLRRPSALLLSLEATPRLFGLCSSLGGPSCVLGVSASELCSARCCCPGCAPLAAGGCPGRGDGCEDLLTCKDVQPPASKQDSRVGLHGGEEEEEEGEEEEGAMRAAACRCLV